VRLLPATMLALLLLHGSTLPAQGVYVTPGEKGPVFSDKPQPGAREVLLPPLNVVAPPPVAPHAVPTSAKAPEKDGENSAAALTYRSFAIVQPANYGSVLANTALFEVRLAVDPPLQSGEGHAFAVSIDGRPVGQRLSANEFIVPPEFWGDTLPSPAQSLQLDASIVDRAGRELARAEPVRFFMRYAPTINTPHRRPHPVPPRPHVPRDPRDPSAAPMPPVGAAPIRPVGAAIKPAD